MVERWVTMISERRLRYEASSPTNHTSEDASCSKGCWTCGPGMAELHGRIHVCGDKSERTSHGVGGCESGATGRAECARLAERCGPGGAGERSDFWDHGRECEHDRVCAGRQHRWNRRGRSHGLRLRKRKRNRGVRVVRELGASFGVV